MTKMRFVGLGPDRKSMTRIARARRFTIKQSETPELEKKISSDGLAEVLARVAIDPPLLRTQSPPGRVKLRGVMRPYEREDFKSETLLACDFATGNGRSARAPAPESLFY